MTNSGHWSKKEHNNMIAIIGDSDIKPGSTKDNIAEHLGKQLVDAGYRVLTGGLGGVMESACRGAHQSSIYKLGDTIGILPGHNPDEANEFADIVIPTGLDYVRNSLVAQADAVIAVGGGAGTLTEMAYAWMFKRLIIAFKIDGWSGRLANTRIDDRIRYPELNNDCVYGVDKPEEAITLLRELLQHYNKRHHGVKRRD